MKTRIRIDERELERVVSDAARKAADAKNAEMRRLAAEYRGRPTGEVKPAVVALFTRDGGRLPDDEAAKYARMISEGKLIEFRVGGAG
ncbi:MAG: hypothetical protein LBC97_11830 [Bifidobacteriaceae bacterium]|jgi:hypothetical protein|nr:hypothetical protein [Bifidobacteriaceae bacterium]